MHGMGQISLEGNHRYHWVLLKPGAEQGEKLAKALVVVGDKATGQHVKADGHEKRGEQGRNNSQID